MAQNSSTAALTNHSVRMSKSDGLVEPSHASEPHVAICDALNRGGHSLKSKMLRNGYLAVALNIAVRGETPSHDVVRPPLDCRRAALAFAPELEMLDGINPKPAIFLSGVLAAALIALTLHPEGLAYFVMLNDGDRERRGNRLSPTAAALDHIDYVIKADYPFWHVLQPDLCARILRSFSAWRRHRDNPEAPWGFAYKLQPMRLDAPIEQVRRQKFAGS